MNRVLLVSDPEIECSESFVERLRTIGIDVCNARDEAACLRGLQQLSPDFLLVDPAEHLTTLESLLALLERGGGCPGRVAVLVTGRQSDQDLADSWGWPRDQCFTRPSMKRG
jgi:hypothetical protein